MRLRQLGSMGLGEIAVRSRQQAAKWLDRAGAHGHIQARSPTTRARADRIASHPFFDGAGHLDLPELLAARMPDARAATIARAEATLLGRFDLLGYRNLSFGDPIDWHLDPVSGRRVQPVHWSRLDPLDHATNGDAKVIWELNRHQWLVQLGQAYRLTGDDRYGDAFADTIERWMQANPPGMGINWASSLEASFRLIAWCWSLHLFHGSRGLSRWLRGMIVDGIRTHATYVERYLSTYFSPNTHLTGEALGLLYAGELLPGTPESQRWRALGERILVEQSDRHVLPDGVYFEQATGYERYTLEFYLHVLMLDAAAGRPAAPAVTAAVHRMLDCLLAIRRPDGSLPHIGDADSGYLLPLAPRGQHDLRGVFAVAAALLGRPDCAWAAGGAAPELLWLLGPRGLAAFDAIDPEPPRAPPSRLLEDGGYVVMQAGWAADRHQLVFDTGPLGCDVTSGHGHADLLSVQCAVFGEPYIVDAGTGIYTGDTTSRTYFRGTAAHSTVMVDGESQAVSTGPFRWAARPRATLRAWRSTPQIDYADADHAAYAHLAGAVRHQRRIVFVKPRYWLIADDLTGEGTHRLDVRFQFAPIDVTLHGTARAVARGRSGGALLVQAFSRGPVHAAIHAGCEAPMQGWTSQEYGCREPSPALVFSATTGLPTRVLTLLLPLGDASASLPSLSSICDSDGTPIGVRFGNGERIWFDTQGAQWDGPAGFPSPLP